MKLASGISILSVMVLALVGLVFLYPSRVAAESDDFGIDATVDALNTSGTNILPKTLAGEQTVPEVIGAVVGYGLSLVAVVFFVLMIYAGARWMLAMGNSESVDKSKQTMEAAGIGLIIVLAAYVLTAEVFKVLKPSAPPLGPTVNNSAAK